MYMLYPNVEEFDRRGIIWFRIHWVWIVAVVAGGSAARDKQMTLVCYELHNSGKAPLYGGSTNSAVFGNILAPP
jgi:hypothetical protein